MTGPDQGSVEALHDLSGDQCLILVRRFEEAIAVLQRRSSRGDPDGRPGAGPAPAGGSHGMRGSAR